MNKSQVIKNADIWRNGYNPLRGLTMTRVVSYLESGERGAYADLQWLYRTIEKRDATLRGVIRKLKASIKKLDWNIKIIDNLSDGQKAVAENQKKLLRAEYERILNLREAIGNLVMAEFRGFAHLEKIYERGHVVSLEFVPQWHWCRDGLYGAWTFNPTSTSGMTSGESVDLESLIIREVDDPADEIALIAFVRKSLSQKDWDAFVETYGIPSLFAIPAENVPENMRDEIQGVIESVIADSRGVLPSGTDLKTPGEGSRGIHPFDSHIRYQDEQIVLAGTSGTLTMLTDSTGMNSGQADAQSETFDALAVALAGDISEVFQQQFDTLFLQSQFPNQPQYVYFELSAKEEADVDAEFDRALKASQSGYKILSSELSEKTGYNLQDAPLPQQQGISLMNRAKPQPSNSFENASKDAFAQALAKDLKPLRQRLEALFDDTTLDDPEKLSEALAQLESELPDLFEQIRKAGATDKALENILMTAATNGIEAAVSKMNQISPKKA